MGVISKINLALFYRIGFSDLLDHSNAAPVWTPFERVLCGGSMGEKMAIEDAKALCLSNLECKGIDCVDDMCMLSAELNFQSVGNFAF